MVAVLHRLAEVAAGDPAQPAAQDPVLERGACGCSGRCDARKRCEDLGKPIGLLVGPVDRPVGLAQLFVEVEQRGVVTGVGGGEQLADTVDVVAGLASLGDLVVHEVVDRQRVVRHVVPFGVC